MPWVTVPRREVVFISWYGFAMAAGISLMLVSAICYTALFGLDLGAKWDSIGWPNKAGFLVTLFASLLGGMSLGGWAWSRVAKHFFGLTRADAELLLLGPQPSDTFIDRLNRRAISKLFGPKHEA
jgi:hypothetical protein